MPLLNYTTKIDASKTIGQIQAILAMAGAERISVDYRDGAPSAVYFVYTVRDQPVEFRIPVNVSGVLRLLQNDPKVRAGLATEEQAYRVAWRIAKDWIEAQIAYVEAEQASIPQLFFPHAVNADGETLYEVFEENQRLLPG